MKYRLMTVLPLAALLMSACGGGNSDASRNETGSTPDSAGTPGTTTGTTTGLSTGQPADTAGMAGGAPGAAPPPPPGTEVDTAGVGTEPPTAGGQVVEEGAVPSTNGTPSAP